MNTSQEKKVGVDELKVLKCLDELTDSWGEKCVSFDWIQDDTKLSRKDVQKTCKILREKELVHFYRGLMDEDGQVAGSGYCISKKGQAIIRPCDKCEEVATYDWWEDDTGEMTFKGIGSKHFQFCETHYQANKSNI